MRKKSSFTGISVSFCGKIGKKQVNRRNKMESHLVRIINRLEAMAKDGGNLKRNFEREGFSVYSA